MKKFFVFSLILFLVYFAFWPVEIDPIAWEPSRNEIKPPKSEAFEIEVLNVSEYGPEDVALDEKGYIYAGTSEGKILKLDSFKTPNEKVYVDTKGRPLGLHFNNEKRLIAADSTHGLIEINSQGKFTVLSASAEGKGFKFADDVDVGLDGTIYFTDASFKFGQEDYKLDAIEHGKNGRLLSYNPNTKDTKILLKDLVFPNGIAVGEDQNFLLVNETWNYRVLKYWLKGPKANTFEVIIDGLPGFPDGISRGQNGVYWIAIASQRDKILDILAKYPSIRKIIARLPKFLLPEPSPYTQVIGIDKEGTIKRHFLDTEGKIMPYITSVEEYNGYLYLGSFKGQKIGRIKI